MKKMELSEFKDRLGEGKMTRRQVNKVLASVGIATIATPIMSRAAKAANDLLVFTWSGYDVPELHGDYIDSYGTSPNFGLFADNDEAIHKVSAGYKPDIVVPTSFMTGRWYDSGLLVPVDTSRLEEWDNLFPELANMEGTVIDGQHFQVPWAWGNSSVLFRADLAPEYSGLENHSWTILWDEEYKGRISQRDSMDAAVLQAALILGIPDMFNMSDADLGRVREKLVEQLPLIRYFWNSQSDAEQSLASGEIVATYAWNSSYASLKREGYDVEYMVPKEGLLTWLDSQVILKDGAGSDKERYDYLNATLTPEAGKFMIEDYGYGSANTRAFEIANQDTLEVFGYSDPSNLIRNSIMFSAFAPKLRDKANLMFEEIKAGF